MSSVIPLILEAIRAALQKSMIDDIAVDDLTRAGLVKVGRFQDNPTTTGIFISIQGGDLDDPNYRDGIITLDEMDNIQFRMPAREIGGGEMWWRRGTIRFGCYYIKEKLSEEDAADAAYTVYQRIQDTVNGVYIKASSGDETAQQIFLYGGTMFESGGPPSSYIWRGKVLWQCLTERNSE
jgi:hypothetical protein